MRLLLFFFIAALALGCDRSRVYETNIDFKDRLWEINKPAKFTFQISDTSKKYNLLMDVRNSMEYPYARLFVNYQLKDKDSISLTKELISVHLFDQKTGKPLGASGIGDIYDHQFSLLKKYSFKKTGDYQMNIQQFMRMDTIPGILAIGLRVESVEGK
ncbi:MAG: gliding motility lipoprotein GldH [Bacteroidetes bacterium]|nr:gliding motility lipoprotein GldH [Bacteroidota bacterium]